ncbi:uncharacterized protein LOC127833831 isoform X2 [Dreissena polymorpha]|uniref:uncharacterized protein LOC127833831 isoform X2 n=1 Tax=Dreissena polymorpha TaxID=45954 RepID=UPI002264B44F|nr:uncharacterized protein LOC127833831 isoform X2 [Dreissena polymorpha]
MNELTVLCMENGCFKVLDTVVNFWIYIHGTKSDPCLTSKVLINVGSRNDQCLVTDFPLNERPCDQYLDQDWYRTDDGVIRTKAPVDGNCGADAAAWLKDALPAVSDGVANRTICIREESNNCEGEFSIEIKNCGLFFVYYLLSIPNIFNCPAAYCFDSSLPCTTSTTTTSTTTTTKTQTGNRYSQRTAKLKEMQIYKNHILLLLLLLQQQRQQQLLLLLLLLLPLLLLLFPPDARITFIFTRIPFIFPHDYDLNKGRDDLKK